MKSTTLYFLVFASLSFVFVGKAHALNINAFLKSYKKVCPKHTDLRAKKVVLQLTRLKNRDTKFICSNPTLTKLLENCNKEEKVCGEVVSIYRKAVLESQGRIIGD